MSLLSALFGTGSTKTEVERPCSNCPSSCSICPNACAQCQPYKEKLLDAIYNVEHEDELLARYEVVADASAYGGTVTCPCCGAPSSNPYVCEYCDSRIAEGTNKIRVSSASELPHPILEAQDIIHERYDTVVKQYDNSSDSSSGSLLGLLADLLGADSDEDVLGSKMTEEEIREAAKLYEVSVAAYLTGLDNGQYLTLSAKKEEDRRKAAYSTAGTAGGVGYAMGNHGYNSGYGSSMNRPMPPRGPMQPPPMGNGFSPQQPRNGQPARQQPSRPVSNARPGQSASRASAPQQPNRPAAQQPSRPVGSTRPDSSPMRNTIQKPAANRAPTQQSARSSASAPSRPSAGTQRSSSHSAPQANRSTGNRSKPSGSSNRGGRK